MSHKTSFSLAALGQIAVMLALYALRLATGGAFALPPNILAILGLTAPGLTFALGWLLTGFTTGDWTVPLFSSLTTQREAQVQAAVAPRTKVALLTVPPSTLPPADMATLRASYAALMDVAHPESTQRESSGEKEKPA